MLKQRGGVEEVGLDARRTAARAGTTTSSSVRRPPDTGYQPGYDTGTRGAGGFTATGAVSFDDGRTWRNATTRHCPDGSFAVTLQDRRQGLGSARCR